MSILVPIAPHVDAVMDPKVYENNDFLSWNKVRIAKSAGFMYYVLLIIVVYSKIIGMNFILYDLLRMWSLA